MGHFAVTLGFVRLILQGIETTANFVDDITQAHQILIDPLESSQCFRLLRLESTNASRLFEDHASVFRRRLQHAIHFSLFNQTVGVNPHTRATKQVFDVFETAGLAIDEILPLATAEDSTSDLNFVGVD